MYTERDRPFLLRRPLQTSLNTTFSPAFRRRDYPLRIFNHTLWGGFDCLFRVRGVKERSLKAAVISSIRVLSAQTCLQTGLGRGGEPWLAWHRFPRAGCTALGGRCEGEAGGCVCGPIFMKPCGILLLFPGKKKLYVGLFLHSKAKSRLG